MIYTLEDDNRITLLRLTARQRVGLAGLFLGSFMLLAILLLYLSEIFGVSAANVHLPFVSSLPPITCKTPHHTTGDSTQTITSGGLSRTFLLHLPPSYGRQSQPVVINYHGYSWSAEQMVRATRMNPLGDQQGFISVYPQGYETPPTWNAGVGAYGPTGSEDDIQFTRDMLTYLEKNYCVNSQRIYITGFSLGGGMAYRLACDLSDQIAAVATASGAYYPLPEGCHPSRPMPVLEIHGAADTSAPYDGNPPLLMASVQDYLNTWLTADKCDTTAHVFLQQPDVTGSEWTHCASGVQIRHYRIADGTHSWPSPAVLNGSAVIWDFFKQFSLPTSPK
jgi:polyhydroxybutyrate depolymerase